jgi:hypothetical protein
LALGRIGASSLGIHFEFYLQIKRVLVYTEVGSKWLLNKTKARCGNHTCNPSPPEAEAERSPVLGQPDYIGRPYPKTTATTTKGTKDSPRGLMGWLKQ